MKYSISKNTMTTNNIRHTFQTRMMIAQLFKKHIIENEAYLNQLMSDLQVNKLPVIIPATGDTLAATLYPTIRRYIEEGETKILVPVYTMDDVSVLGMSIIVVSAANTTGFSSLTVNDMDKEEPLSQIGCKTWSAGPAFAS